MNARYMHKLYLKPQTGDNCSKPIYGLSTLGWGGDARSDNFVVPVLKHRVQVCRFPVGHSVKRGLWSFCGQPVSGVFCSNHKPMCMNMKLL